jgi:cyclic patellamide precursor peptide PatG
METELNEQTANQPGVLNMAQSVTPVIESNSTTAPHRHVRPATCASCGAAAASNGYEATAPSYVYAIGNVEMRFPNLSVEKEFAQATAGAGTQGLTNQATLHSVLAEPANRYLARQACWVFTIEGMETYILVPRDPTAYDQLIEAVRSRPSRLDIDVLVGVRGPIAPPEMCNGLMVPIVAFDQIYSFDRDSLIGALPKRAKGTKSKNYDTAAAEELLNFLMLLADNAGSTDEHRAVNYLAVRYPAVYETVATALDRNAGLTAVDVQPSPLSGTRNIVDVIFSFTNRNTLMVEKFYTCVDVTEKFPFLCKSMSPYFDR